MRARGVQFGHMWQRFEKEAHESQGYTGISPELTPLVVSTKREVNCTAESPLSPRGRGK